MLEGTGFVFSDHKVMTNAHVVGGVDEPTVQIGGEGRLYDAKVVLYDWQRDIAVLDVPDLDAQPLQRKRGGSIADMAERHVRLDREDIHNKRLIPQFVMRGPLHIPKTSWPGMTRP